MSIEATYKQLREVYESIKELEKELNSKDEEITKLKKDKKMLLAQLTRLQNVGGSNSGTIEEPQSIQLLSGDSSSYEDEADNVNDWSGFYKSTETSDTNNSTYCLRMTGGTNYRLSNKTISNLTIGDTLTISFDAKCNTQNQQNFELSNTSNDDTFWLAGEQPLTWQSYTRTVTATSTEITLTVIGSLGGGVNGDYILIDNLSVLKGAVEEPVTDDEAPTAPSNLSTTNVGITSVSVSWNESTDNVGVTNYEVYQDSVKVKDVSGTSTAISGLTADTSYSFYVIAQDEAGNSSSASNTINVTTNEELPSGTFAFPTAKGAGANTTGGRGGQVIHVTTLDWDAVGGLKEAIQTQGARTIVFDVSGEIDATSEGAFAVLINGSNYDNLTIAGQTAPEGGITIKTSYFMFQDVDNVIVRHVRFRNEGIVIEVGESQYLPDAFKFLGGNNIIFDHCTFSHGMDQSATWGNTSGTMGNVTVQNCFFQDSKTGSILGVDEVEGDFTFINNVYSNVSHRHPNPKGNGQYDIINNIVYNWRTRLIRITHDGTYNVVNNYYKPSNGGLRSGSWFGSGTIPATALQKLQMKTGNTPLIYTSGNIITGQRETPQSDDSDMWVYFAASDAPYTENTPVDSQFFTDTQFDLVGQSFTIDTANNAYNNIVVNGNLGAYKYLDNNGTVGIYRDTKDTADLSMIINDTYSGSFYDDNSSIPHPTIPENTRPVNFYDSNDHIPESYLTARGITGNSTIHNQVQSSGYTLLEEYINQVDA